MPKKHQRIVMLICSIFLALALAACSSSQQAEDKSSGKQAAKERVVKHAMGETKVADQPDKVIVLDNGTLDNVLALDVKPVGAATVFIDEPFPSYLKDQAAGIKNIGTVDQPNLEAIASLKPDLILGSKDTHEAIYDKLAKIAPTVFVEELGVTWKENLKLQAEALGKTEEGEKILGDYQQRLDDFKQKMGENAAHSKISILRARTDHVAAYLKDSFSGAVIQDAGLPRPPAQNKNEFSVQLTEEQIDDMEGDVIFWFTRDKENLLNTKIMKNPAWNELTAVKEKKVYQVNDETWLSGLGVQAANHIMDDLSNYLLKHQ